MRGGRIATETERQTDRQTDRQSDRQKQADRMRENGANGRLVTRDHAVSRTTHGQIQREHTAGGITSLRSSPTFMPLTPCDDIVQIRKRCCSIVVSVRIINVLVILSPPYRRLDNSFTVCR